MIFFQKPSSGPTIFVKVIYIVTKYFSGFAQPEKNFSRFLIKTALSKSLKGTQANIRTCVSAK